MSPAQPAAPVPTVSPLPQNTQTSPPPQQGQATQQIQSASPPEHAQGQHFDPAATGGLPGGRQGNQRPQAIGQNQEHPSTSNASAPTHFIAELPADLGNLSVSDKANAPSASVQEQQSVPADPQHSTSPSQRLPGPQGFTIPRRAVSTSSQPVLDQWKIWDPATEQPTPEFFTLADLVFDALDRKYEPKNTGLLEAYKLMSTFDIQGHPQEVKGK